MSRQGEVGDTTSRPFLGKGRGGYHLHVEGPAEERKQEQDGQAHENSEAFVELARSHVPSGLRLTPLTR